MQSILYTDVHFVMCSSVIEPRTQIGTKLIVLYLIILVTPLEAVGPTKEETQKSCKIFKIH